MHLSRIWFFARSCAPFFHPCVLDPKVPQFFDDLVMPNKRSLSSSPLNEADLSEAIKLAWEDRTAFETIQERLGISETELVRLMRKELTPSSFKMWRMRMRGRKTKHRFLRVPEMKFDDLLIANHRRANC